MPLLVRNSFSIFHISLSLSSFFSTPFDDEYEGEKKLLGDCEIKLGKGIESFFQANVMELSEKEKLSFFKDSLSSPLFTGREERA